MSLLGLHLDAASMQQMVLTIPTPAFVKDRSSRFVVCNQALADYAALDWGQMVGLSDIDMPWADVGGHGYRDWDRRIMRTGESVLEIAESIRTAAGSVRSIDTNKFPVRDARGSVVGVLGYFNERGRPALDDAAAAQPESPFLIEDIVMRYLGGESVSRIAETTTVPPSAVYAALRDQGCVASWQSSPTHWSHYPVFLAALRSCRLELLRDEFRLEKYGALSSVYTAELALVRGQIAALNQAIAEMDLHRVHGILDGFLQNRSHELRALADSAIRPDRVVHSSEWAQRFTPSMLHSRHATELERIETDRSAIDRELRGAPEGT